MPVAFWILLLEADGQSTYIYVCVCFSTLLYSAVVVVFKQGSSKKKKKT